MQEYLIAPKCRDLKKIQLQQREAGEEAVVDYISKSRLGIFGSQTNLPGS